MNVSTLFRGNPSKKFWGISLKTTIVDLLVVMQDKKSEDRQSHKDSSSGDNECL